MRPLPRHLRVLLLALGALALLTLLASNWNWARPMLVGYLEHHSHRRVQIDGLQVQLDAQWQPVVTLHGVRIANAPWAQGPQPFATAREARFTFDWASLWREVRIVRELRLVDADIDLQRRADGLRNWRLTRPDDRGPARMRILRLQAEHSRLRLTHEGIGLVLEAASTPLSQPVDGHAQRIAFHGTLRSAAFNGQAESGPVLSMVDTGEFFPLRGQAVSQDTRLEVQGRIADLLQLGSVDAQIRLQGATLAQLQAFVPRPQWPASRPYRFSGRLVRHGSVWSAEGASLQLGRSDLAGRGTYQHDGRRGNLQASLASNNLHLTDWPARPSATPAPLSPRSTTRVLPSRAVPLEGLRSADGRIEIAIATLHASPLPPSHRVRGEARLDHGLLTLELHSAEFAEGRLRGRATLDARQQQPTVHLALQADHLQLDRLWPSLKRQPGVTWPRADVKADLRGHGDSLAGWLGTADGRLELAFSGGSLSRKLDARLGLDAGRMLGALFQGDKPVPIRCAAVSLDFQHGLGRTRGLVIDTERTQVNGEGRLHLNDETWALVLTPQTPRLRPLALPASILAQGTFRSLQVQVVQRPQASTQPVTGCPGLSVRES